MSKDQMDGESVVYTDAHRAFLQAFMAQSVMTVDEMKPIIALALTAQGESPQKLNFDIQYQQNFRS